MAQPRADYKVDPDTGCWVWQRMMSGETGYGRMWRDGKRIYAHRVYYEWYVEPIPEGLQIDHLCRNRACVNPAHLEAVTNQTNSRRGDRTILTVEDVRRIKTLLTKGVFQQTIAKEFGVAPRTIGNIKQGITWKDIFPLETEN